MSSQISTLIAPFWRQRIPDNEAFVVGYRRTERDRALTYLSVVVHCAYVVGLLAYLVEGHSHKTSTQFMFSAITTLFMVAFVWPLFALQQLRRRYGGPQLAMNYDGLWISPPAALRLGAVWLPWDEVSYAYRTTHRGRPVIVFGTADLSALRSLPGAVPGVRSLTGWLMGTELFTICSSTLDKTVLEIEAALAEYSGGSIDVFKDGRSPSGD